VGAGSYAANEILRTTTSVVSSQSSVTAKSLSVQAMDASQVLAVAGAVAAQLGGSISLAVGVSIAENQIGSEDATRPAGVMAVVDDSTVTLRGGSLSVLADARPSVTSWSIAGTGQVAKGTGATLALAGAGAGNSTYVAIDVLAAVRANATVTTDATVEVSAKDATSISSNAGGAGLSVALSDAATVGVTVGAARNVNTITSTNRALVESARVEAGGDVRVTARSSQELDVLVFGVGISVSSSNAFGASFAGSGAAAWNKLQTKTQAEILSSNVRAGTTGSGSVQLTAIDDPTAKTLAAAGSLALAVGATGSFGLAPGIVLAETLTANVVEARIGTVDGSQAAPNVTAEGSGSVDVTAQSRASITSTGVAIAAAAAFSPYFNSVAFAGAYASGVGKTENVVTAEIVAGTVRGKQVNVEADSAHTILGTVGAGAATLAWFGGSVGWSESMSTVADKVVAQVGAAVVEARAGDVVIRAAAANDLFAHTVASAIAIAIGGSLNSASSKASDLTQVTAQVLSQADIRAKRAVDGAGAPVFESGRLVVVAAGVPGSHSGRVEAKSEGGSAGLITVGLAGSEAESKVQRLAWVDADVDLSHVAVLDLDATSKPRVESESL
jgi:hypothetical protein